LKDALEWAWELGIECVTVFAFSVENFKRSADEVESLMKLSHDYLLKHVPELSKRACIKFSGDLSLLPPTLRVQMVEAQRASAAVEGATLNICFAYTATQELASAIARISCAIADSRLMPEDATPALFERCLESHDLPSPDVDLLIRTSGEIRLSDFLLWQGSSSCLLFWDVLWPDFSPLHLYASVFLYQQERAQMVQQRIDDPGTALAAKPGAIPPLWKSDDVGQRVRVEAFLKRLEEDRDEAERRAGTLTARERLLGRADSTH